MMYNEIYFCEWNTIHDHMGKTMTHVFPKAVKCIVSWVNCTITITHHDKTVWIKTFYPAVYGIDDHFNLVLRIASVVYHSFFPCVLKKRLKNIS